MQFYKKIIFNKRKVKKRRKKRGRDERDERGRREKVILRPKHFLNTILNG